MPLPLCKDCRYERDEWCTHPNNVNVADGQPEDCCRAERLGTLLAFLFGQCGRYAHFFEPRKT